MSASRCFLRSGSATRGFALIVTVVLVAFLVLILVGLATFTRVETQVASNSQDLAAARQNALFALNIAMGQLQKNAGPDQRTTATADLAGDGNGDRLVNGATPSATVGATKYWDASGTSNGLEALQPGTRYWTGVWGNSHPSAPTSGNDNAYEKTPRPVLLNWLVSGNEKASFNASSAADSFGRITASNGGGGTTPPEFKPGLPVSSLNATAMIATTALQIKDRNDNNRDAVLLVGQNSAGTQTHSTSGEVAIDRFVVAPLVEISSSSVPGVEGDQTIGRYAYWVGDENVKARMNLTDRYADKTNASSTEEAAYRLMTAPRTGLEVVNDASIRTNYAASTQNTNLANNIAVRVQMLPQAPFLGSATARVRMRFHELSTSSEGVLADAYHGGLRRDLSAEFQRPTLGTWTGTNLRPAGAGASIIPTAYSPNYSGASSVPRWDVLRDFYRLYNDHQVSGAVPVQAASLTKMGLAPQLLQFRMIVGVNATSGEMIKGLFTPLLVLGNPYSTPLRLSGLRVQFSLAEPFGTEIWPRPVGRMIALTLVTAGNGGDVPPAFERFMRLFTYEGDTGNGLGALAGAVTFTLPTTTLQPGEAKVFSLNESHDVASSPIPLVAGDPGDFAGAYHYVYRTSSRPSPATGSAPHDYKFTESDRMTPVVIKIMDSANQTVLRVAGLNIDATTDTFGFYHEPNGATNTERVVTAYNFDLGDPGVPSSLADTALRTYADFNPRAAVTRLTNASYLLGAYFRYSPNLADLATANTVTPSVPPPTFTSNLDPVEWGRHGQSLSPVLYDLPRGSMPVLSMGQLQHANITADDIALNVGHQPALAIGNSYASPFLTRGLTVQARTDTYNSDHTVSGDPTYTATRNYYDISYLLNAALWDGYFFSGVPQTGATHAPLNPRLELTADTTATQARDGGEAAAHLLVKGAFNINSTSVEAWAAVLAGMRGLPALPVAGATDNSTTSVFPRSLRQPANALTAGNATSATSPSGDGDDSYSGFRRLTDAQIRTLAQEIVRQVRMRGPFVSVAQFVNRVLVPASSDTAGLGFCGALQAAIDKTTINNFSNVTATADRTDIPTSHTYYAEPTHFATNAPRAPQRSTSIPAWLTQADLLQAIGPVIASRSDTFVIRTYGDVMNPVVSTTEPVARAWCEAVVQRLPEYVDGANTATVHPSASSAENQRFGRRFQVVSFRWLSPDDI